jgi:hypothetical protein
MGLCPFVNLNNGRNLMKFFHRKMSVGFEIKMSYQVIPWIIIVCLPCSSVLRISYFITYLWCVIVCFWLQTKTIENSLLEKVSISVLDRYGWVLYNFLTKV